MGEKKNNTDTKAMKKLKKVVEKLENNYSVIMAIKERSDDNLDEIPDHAVAIPMKSDDILMLLCLIIDHLKNSGKLHIVISALVITEIFRINNIVEHINKTIH